MIKKILAFLFIFAAAIMPAAAQSHDYENIVGGDAEKKKQTPKYSYLYDTSLIRAIKSKDIDRITLLLYANINTNDKNDEGYTPLYVAADTDLAIDTVTAMLQRDAKVNLTSKGGITPLMVAASKGRKAMVKLFLEYGADPSIQDENGMTALLYAVKNKYSDVVPLLANIKKAGLELRDKNNMNAVLYALQNKDFVTMKELVKAGADINTKDVLGKTPLILACDDADLESVRTILALGANKEIKDNTGRAALPNAVQVGALPVIKYLAKAGANLETRDLIDSTPFIIAAKDKNNAVVKELADCGADINAQDKLKRSALIWAVQNSDGAMLSTLLGLKDIQVNVNFGADNMTPLMAAAQNKDYNSVLKLAKAGADLEGQDANGNTALFYAVRANDLKTASFLIKNGADVNTANAKGEKPLEIARANDNTKMAELIISAPVKAKPELVQTDSAFWDKIQDIDAYIASLQQLLKEAQQVKAEREAQVKK